MRGTLSFTPPIMAEQKPERINHYAETYPVEMYIAYTQSIALEVEKLVRDNPPSRPAQYWRMYEGEINRARWRMRNVSGTFWKAKHPRGRCL